MGRLVAWEYDILRAYAPILARVDEDGSNPDPWAGVDSNRDDLAVFE